MKTNLPTGKKDYKSLPPTKVIEDILRRFCKKTQLDSNGIATVISGDAHDHYASRPGVRIVSYNDQNPYSVHVIIGCGTISLRGYISYREKGKGVRNTELYNRLSEFFENGGKDKFISVDEVTTTKPSTDKPSTSPTPVEIVAVELTAPRTPEPPVKDIVISNHIPQNHEANYRRFFEDEKNLHLAVVAFVATYKPGEIFNFDDFCRILVDEVGLTGLSRFQMTPMIRCFSIYIRCVNPDKAPKRYTLTDAAPKYASQNPSEVLAAAHEDKKVETTLTVTPIPEEIQAVPQKQLELTEKTPVDVGLQPTNLVEQFGALKKSEIRYQDILGQIERKNQAFKGLNLDKLREESRDTASLIASLNDQIRELEQRKATIDQTVAVNSNAESEIALLWEQIHRDGLEEKHRSYHAMKQQLAELMG